MLRASLPVGIEIMVADSGDGRRLLITDVDNTLFDFGAYFEAGLTALVEFLCDRLKSGRDEVTDRLREVYRRHGSIEYPFAVEDISADVGMCDAERDEFVRHSLAIFWQAAASELRPYETVRETLSHLAHDGVIIIAHTDAPIHEAVRRLRLMRLDRYLTGIVAQQWFPRRPARSRVVYLRELPGWHRPRRMTPRWEVPLSDRKPSSGTYERIARRFDTGTGTVIGDSVTRDLIPALDVGFTAVLAAYGHRHKAEGLLREVVPHVLPEVGQSRGKIPFGIHRAVRFSDVVRHLTVRQTILDPNMGEL
jgi:phosphoglycolate phosphatase